MIKQCLGCGANLQSDNPNQTGYLPGHLLNRRQSDLICQRCYRIKHYGRDIDHDTAIDWEHVLKQKLKWADALIIVFDVIDFEASIPDNIGKLIKRKTVFGVINKVDLLPPKTRTDEVRKWAEDRLRRYSVSDIKLFTVSSLSGLGIESLLTAVKQHSAQNWLVIGVTNVGKSSLISQIVQQKGISAIKPTTSVFAGTTVECVNWVVGKSKILADSPGVVPKGRLTDIVCTDCSIKLIASKRLNIKVYSLKANQAIAIPGLAALVPEIDHDRTKIVGVTASTAYWHRINNDRVAFWLESNCDNCRVSEWARTYVKIPANYDLIIHGLGWVSVKGIEVECELTIPRNVRYSLRPNLFGKKDYNFTEL